MITTRKRVWTIRVVLVALALCAWFFTQSLIGKRPAATDAIGDAVLSMTASQHQFFVDHPAAANTLLIVSSAFIDAFGLFLLGSAIFGPSIRPFLGLVMIFALRQMCQAIVNLPSPEGKIWHDPGFPSLLVTYGVANDLFFSGHTAIAVYGAVELSRLNRRWLIAAGVFVASFEIVVVLVLRAHYTLDVFTGAVTALLVAGIAARIAPACDRKLEGWAFSSGP